MMAEQQRECDASVAAKDQDGSRTYKMKTFTAGLSVGALVMTVANLARPSTSSPRRLLRDVEVTRISVVRPYVEADADELVESFDEWNKFPPCQKTDGEDSPPYAADLFLSFSQSQDSSAKARDAVNAIGDKFLATEGWGGCFQSIHIIDADLDPEEDVYDVTERATNVNWVNGPNRHFERIFRSMQGGQDDDDDEFSLFYLMEKDSSPIKRGWLDDLVREIEEEGPFAVLGSTYEGGRWEGIEDELSPALLDHLNGNAVYNTSHPLLDRLIGQLESEATTVHNSIPYDYRMSQILLEGEFGIVPDLFPTITQELSKEEVLGLSSNTDRFANWWDSYGEQDPFRQSKIIANFASTNTLPQHVRSDASIIHGPKMYSSWEPSQHEITLVVSGNRDDNAEDLLADLDSITHPFSRIVVVLPQDNIGSAPLDLYHTIEDKEAETRTPVSLHHRNSPAYMDLCDAPVSTEWFMIARASSKPSPDGVDLMFTNDEVKKPVVPYKPATGAHCKNSRSCQDMVKLARDQFYPDHDRVVEESDILYRTKERDAFCSVWKWEERRNGDRAERRRTTARVEGPTATSYLAYLHSTSVAQDIYAFTDLTVYGTKANFATADAEDEWMDKKEGMRRVDGQQEPRSLQACGCLNDCAQWGSTYVDICALSECCGCAQCSSFAWQKVTYDNFEKGWGNWNKVTGVKGSDAARFCDASSPQSVDSCSLRIRDNSGSLSSVFTDSLDFTDAVTVRVQFWFYALSMEDNEAFVLEISPDGGNSWSTVEKWTIGGSSEYQNKESNKIELDLESTEWKLQSEKAQFRFRCDASNNKDHIYLDDITIMKKVSTTTNN